MDDKRKIRQFQTTVRTHYRKHGRDLPWRKTRDPYKILVSEVMLQQTQVDRVVPYYKNFLKKFPTVHALARAKWPDVLRSWQGLGYNRRALFLHRASKLISDGSAYSEKLPGVGAYTRSAVMVFAFNKANVLIETNIRAVYLHEFFRGKQSVADSEIVRYIELSLDHKNPREWYWALMDYGSYLKRTLPNPSRRSKHHTKQSPFKGSRREIRGKILKTLLVRPVSRKNIVSLFPIERSDEVANILNDLVREGFAKKQGSLLEIV